MDLVSENVRRCFSACDSCRAPLAARNQKTHHRHKIITSDCYVKVCLSGATVARTRVISNSQNPNWNESFHIALAHPASYVEFQVKDNDVFGAQIMGIASIPAQTIKSGESINDWFPIIGSYGKPPKPDSAILLEMKFTSCESNPLYQQGIAADPAHLGVRHTYFPLRKGGSVTLYQDAHVLDRTLPDIELEEGKVFHHDKCWEDICHAISGAHHMIYIVGWSIYHKVKLIREPTRPFPRGGNLTLGDLLKYKSEEGVRVLLLVWDDKTSHKKFFINTEGVMGTHDEETRKFFKHSSVICALAPRYGSSKLSIVKQKVVAGADISELPKEIGDLILLKYLGLRGNLLRKLPTSIGNLINLHTLDLLETYIEVTPYMLRNMHQLRHLICPRDWNIRNPRVSNRIDHLRNLQTLVTVAGRWINGSGLEMLSNLRHLQLGGRLLDYSKALSNSLANFQRLQSLTLRNYSSEAPSESKTLPLVSFSPHMHLTRLVLAGPMGKLPDKEDFPPNLASLELYESLINISVDPMATLEKLPNLRALTLDSNVYNGRKMTCSGGGFANLHHLEISRLYNLVEWIVEEGAMPNLKSLLLWHCSQLKVISDSLKHIPTLKEVEFRVMPVEIKNWWQQSSGSRSDGGEDTEITNVDSSGGTWSGHEGGPKEICVGEAKGASTSEVAKEIVSEKRS